MLNEISWLYEVLLELEVYLIIRSVKKNLFPENERGTEVDSELDAVKCAYSLNVD